MIRGIQIDAEKQMISQVEIKGDLKSMYEIVNANIIEIAGYFENGDHIYVDEEGRLKPIICGFMVSNFSRSGTPFVGNGLILSLDRNGDVIDCKSTLQEIKQKVHFWTKDNFKNSFVYYP